MFSIAKAHYYKNPFIGLFMRTNDRHTLLPRRAPAPILASVETLSTEPVELFINQSPLLGLFCVMNSAGCLLYADAEETEKKVLRKLGYNVYTFKNSLAPGNVVLANDKAVFCSGEVPIRELKSIGDALGVEAFQSPLSGMHTPGSLNVVTNAGLFAYNEITEVDFQLFQMRFGVLGQNGTCNTGTIYNSLGVVANRHGALVGETTTGFEIQRIYEGLGGE